jgi:hypothetical protein
VNVISLAKNIIFSHTGHLPLSVPAPMLSFFVNGFFAVKSSHRVVVQCVVNETTFKSNYIHYQTALQCTTGVSYGTELCVFATSQSTILPDNSIAHIIAKAEINAGCDAFLEAVSFTVIPGDPSDNNYEDHIPNEPYAHIFILGQVIKESAVNMKITTYTIIAADYVKDGSAQSLVQCV